jgi:hypothetical protein
MLKLSCEQLGMWLLQRAVMLGQYPVLQAGGELSWLG